HVHSETQCKSSLDTVATMFRYEEDDDCHQLAVNARKRAGDDRNVLSASQMREKHPLSRTPDDGLGVFDKLGGAVRSEMAVFSAVHGAQKLGAEVYTDTKVHGGALHKARGRVFTRDREFTVEKIVV